MKYIFIVTLIIFALYVLIRLLTRNINAEDTTLDSHNYNHIETEEAYLKSYGAPKDCNQFVFMSGIQDYQDGSILHVWKNDEGLNLLDDFRIKYLIPIENIFFFTIKGDIKYQTEPDNHNKTGMTNTMINEALFGTAAAMKKGQQPALKVITEDERFTIIKAKINENDSFILFYKSDLYYYLLKQIPEKERSFISM